MNDDERRAVVDAVTELTKAIGHHAMVITSMLCLLARHIDLGDDKGELARMAAGETKAAMAMVRIGEGDES